MSGPPAMQEGTSKLSFSFRLSLDKHLCRLVENQLGEEPMPSYRKSQYISQQAEMPDILSLHPIFQAVG
jgi:hypothetical protein